jgi:hypothetical protein
VLKILDRQVTQVQCEEICIADAEMIITRNRLGDGDRFRLIILSRNRCTVMSQICESNVSADAIFCHFAVLMMSVGK